MSLLSFRFKGWINRVFGMNLKLISHVDEPQPEEEHFQ
jgi:hypothetical protein